MAALTGVHLPVRPSWACACCGKDWPCDPAREALTDEQRRDMLYVAIYMCGQLEHAVADLDGLVPVDELFDRFIAWTRPRPLDVTAT